MNDAGTAPSRLKTKPAVTWGIVACLALWGVLTACWLTIEWLEQRALLRRILRGTLRDVEVIASGRERAVLFGDSGFAWHVRFRREGMDLPRQAKVSDKSDLDETIDLIQRTLQQRIDGLRSPQVYKMDVGRVGVCLVREDRERHVYIYAWCK